MCFVVFEIASKIGVLHYKNSLFALVNRFQNPIFESQMLYFCSGLVLFLIWPRMSHFFILIIILILKSTKNVYSSSILHYILSEKAGAKPPTYKKAPGVFNKPPEDVSKNTLMTFPKTPRTFSTNKLIKKNIFRGQRFAPAI